MAFSETPRWFVKGTNGEGGIVSADEGDSGWTVSLTLRGVSAHPYQTFRYDDGDLLLVFRDDRTRQLFCSFSNDGGVSWSEAVKTPIDGYPPYLDEYRWWIAQAGTFLKPANSDVRDNYSRRPRA